MSFCVNGRPERTFTPRTRRERGAAGYVLACHRCTQRPGTALRLKVPPRLYTVAHILSRVPEYLEDAHTRAHARALAHRYTRTHTSWSELASSQVQARLTGETMKDTVAQITKVFTQDYGKF